GRRPDAAVSRRRGQSGQGERGGDEEPDGAEPQPPPAGAAADDLASAAGAGRLAPLVALFDQHNGDVVADRVAALAGRADELLALEGDGRLAGRTRKDVEQVLADRHGHLLV